MTGFYDWPQEQQETALRHLAATALTEYPGEFSQPELVKYRENAIFSVKRDDGERFVVRIHRHDYHSDAALASELAWMESLFDSGLPVPQVLRCKHDRAMVLGSDAAVPEARQVDLLTWVNGVSLGRMEESGTLSLAERCAIYRNIGALTARLHNHAVNWSLPSSFTRHDWFAQSLIGAQPRWGPFWELEQLTPDQRDLLLRARRHAAQALETIPRTRENSGLIHADLLQDNLLIDGDTVKPIDFDDAGFGWHMFDMATTLYFLLGEQDYPALRAALITGYRAERDLPAEQENSLDLFLMIRGTTYLGWVGSRKETPTARELAPVLIERACNTCEQYLAGRPLV